MRKLIAALVGAVSLTSVAWGADLGGTKNLSASDAANLDPRQSSPWTACWGGIGAGGQIAATDFGIGLDGYQYGLSGGCDYQLGHFVVGLLADVDWGKLTGQNISVTTQQWGIGGRVGFLVTPQTGVFALVKREETKASIGGFSTTLDGWAVGGEVEHMFTRNVGARVKYEFQDYSNVLNSGLDARDHIVMGELVLKFPVGN